MLRSLIVLAISAAMTGLLGAQDIEEQLRLEREQDLVIEGHVDWGKYLLVACGEDAATEGLIDPVQRRLMGFRAAKAAAYRNLLVLAGEVRIDAGTKAGEAMAGNDTLRSRIAAIVRAARVTPGSNREVDGGYRLALQLNLLDEFADAVLPLLTSVPPGREFVSGLTDTLAPYIPAAPYTGLLVDARGLSLRPCMVPRILGKNGSVLYSAGSVERHQATRMGVVGYYDDMEQAASSDRLGGEEADPLIVKAEDVAGLFSCDVVLGEEDALRLYLASEESNLLGGCRVALVIGPEPVSIDSTAADSTLLDSTLQISPYLEENIHDLPGEAGADSGPE